MAILLLVMRPDVISQAFLRYSFASPHGFIGARCFGDF